MELVNLSNEKIIATHCIIADRFFTRFMGLMGRKELCRGHALLIQPCNSVHMFFMRFPLDLVFLDRNFNVLQTVENIRPWHVSKIIRKAYATLELPVGTINDYQISVGNHLVLKP